MGTYQMAAELAAETAEPALLWQRILGLPAKHGFRHENVLAMRWELRQLLLRELLGPYSSVLFGDASVQARASRPPNEWLPGPLPSMHTHPGRPCARRLIKGEPTHRCLTCGLDETCVLCKYCYNPAEHEGHDVFVRISSRDDGGICDCGDPEAWQVALHCRSDEGNIAYVPLPEDLATRARAVLSTMLDFAVDVFTGAPLAKERLPPLDALLHWTEQAQIVPELRGVTDLPPAPEEWCLLVYDDDRRSVMDLGTTIGATTGRSASFVKTIGRKVQKDGRALIATSSDPAQLLAHAAHAPLFPLAVRPLLGVLYDELADEIIRLLLDLTKCRVQQYDPAAFMTLVSEALLAPWVPGVRPREFDSVDSVVSVYGDAVELLTDLHGLDVPTDDQTETWDCLFDKVIKADDDEAWPHEHDYEIFGPRGVASKASHAFVQTMARAADELAEPGARETRNVTSSGVNKRPHVLYLMFCDVRLYKSLRKILVDLYVATLVSTMSLKREFGEVYGKVYPRLVGHHAHVDRYPYMSVTTQLSSQLFTTPSIATMLMEASGFEVYMRMLFRLFTKNGLLEPKVFRNRRFGQTYLELLSLMMRNTRKDLVGGSGSRLARTAEFLGLFQGLAPIQRENGEHVLYESERWIYWYSTMPFILQLARSVAVGVQDSPPDKLPARGIRAIASALIAWQDDADAFLERRAPTLGIAYADLPRVDCTRSPRDVFNDPVSLLQPVHAFLGWLLEYVPLRDRAQLRELLVSPDQRELALFDAPMCTLATLAQISAGLWVRNGYTIRYQLQCYRDTLLRDIAFAQDVFMVQMAFCVLEPNLAFCNLAHHFGISNWPALPNSDDQQAFYVLDEFLHCITYLVCNRLKLQGAASLDTKNRIVAIEIIQALWFNSMSYSELVKQVPECISTDEMFDRILRDCATFQPPTGTHGSGIYALKPELYEKFDPQYTFFSLSRIEEAERLVETRDPQKVHVPPLLPLAPAFSHLTLFARSAAFARVMSNLITLLLASSFTQTEQSLGRMIYLLLVLAKDDLEYGGTRAPSCFDTFAGLIKARAILLAKPFESASILDMLYHILESDRFLSLAPKVSKLLEVLHEQDPSIELPRSQNFSPSDIILQEENKRRAKGKEMQKKVLAEFQRQQRQFMQANLDHEGMELDDSSANGDESEPSEFTFPKHCVLCCMPEEENSILGMLTYTSQIRLLRNLPSSDEYWVHAAYAESPSLDVEHPFEPTSDGTEHMWGPAYPKESILGATNVLGCGHGVHHHCFTEFLAAQQQQRMTTRFMAENLAKGEFLCPLCHGLNNGFMPVMAATNPLEASTLLAEREDPVEDVDLTLDAQSGSSDLTPVIRHCLSLVSPKFAQVIESADYRSAFNGTVRTVLLDHMLKIQENASGDSDAIYGLRSVFFSFSSTITQIEIALRGVKHSSVFGGILVDQLNARTVEFLRVFAQYVSTLTGLILSSFLYMDASLNPTKLSPVSGEDTLSRLVVMFIFGSAAYGTSRKTALRLAYVTEILRVLININEHKLPNMPDLHAEELDSALVSEIQRWTNRDPNLVYRVLKYHITPVMRRYALLVFSMTGKYDGDDFAGMMALSEEERLAQYLQLPSLKETLLRFSTQTPEGHAARKLAACYYGDKITLSESLEYPGVYRLIRLRHNLEAMLNAPEQTMPANPAICLICGALCCMQETDDDMEISGFGQCNLHLETCGLTQGIFLIPRRNVILLLLAEGRGTFVKTPYLDLHGESDESMRRGRPHFLLPVRYEAFMREVWLQNGLPSLVARKLDQSQDTGGWETL